MGAKCAAYFNVGELILLVCDPMLPLTTYVRLHANQKLARLDQKIGKMSIPKLKTAEHFAPLHLDTSHLLCAQFYVNPDHNSKSNTIGF